MDLSRAELAVESIDSGLKKYLYIMSKLHTVDVSKDADFQTKYNGFYRIRQRKPEFYRDYYYFMEVNKRNEISFAEALHHFYDRFGRVEASFSSKLVATINPNLPVWDAYVLQNLKLKKPSYGCKDRLERTINLYSQIHKWYLSYLMTDESKELLGLFNRKYPNVNITDIKKIDLILWQMR